MDNVVQNINIEDIVPSNFHNSKKQHTSIEELAQSIKNYGILEPLLLRPNNGKYEIILGNNRYQAAIIAGLHTVPALVKNVDDNFIKNLYHNNKNVKKEILKQEKNSHKKSLDQKQLKDQINQNSNKFINNNQSNQDIVNLSELNQKEYERKDDKMNNNIPQPQPTNQEPTFGEKFFPSLEDEPTNMNIGPMNPPQPEIVPQQPTPAMPNLNNNLIDLTESNSETMAPSVPPVAPTDGNPSFPTVDPTQTNPSMPNISPEISPMNPTQPMEPTPPGMDNIINLDSLQNNNPSVSPVENPIPTMDNNFSQPIQPPQFDMSQSINPIPTPEQPISPTPSFVQSDINANPTPMIDQSTQTVPETPSIVPEMPVMPTLESTPSPINPTMEPVPPVVPTMDPIQPVMVPGKDVTPVKNIITNIAASLESFGYKITTTEEELPTTSKITIEIEK